MSPYRGSEQPVIPEGVVRYFKVDRRDHVYLKFILEAYEGMSTLSTAAPKEGILRLSVPFGFVRDMQSLIDTIGRDIPIHEVTFESEDTVNA